MLSIEPHLKVFEGYSDFDATEMNNKFHFKSNREAFDAAVKAIKEVLVKEGYKETEGGFMK